MTSEGVETIGPREPTSAARATMRRHKVRHLVVVDRGRVVGIVSERDFGRAGRSGPDGSLVQDVMTTDVVSATPGTTVRQAANLMRGRAIGSVLVVDGDQLIGLVTTTHMLNQLCSTSSTGERRCRRGRRVIVLRRRAPPPARRCRPRCLVL
jgi:acetoin utilization protein AcuB